MAAFYLTRRAKEDLKEIGRYTLREHGKAQRNAYLGDLDGRFRWLAAHPRVGTAIDEIREGYRRWPEGQHVIFYRQTVDGIEIVRVPHRRMEPGRHLGEEGGGS